MSLDMMAFLLSWRENARRGVHWQRTPSGRRLGNMRVSKARVAGIDKNCAKRERIAS